MRNQQNWFLHIITNYVSYDHLSSFTTTIICASHTSIQIRASLSMLSQTETLKECISVLISKSKKVHTHSLISNWTFIPKTGLSTSPFVKDVWSKFLIIFCCIRSLWNDGNRSCSHLNAYLSSTHYFYLENNNVFRQNIHTFNSNSPMDAISLSIGLTPEFNRVVRELIYKLGLVIDLLL